MRQILVLSLALAIPLAAHAQVISTRGDLNSILTSSTTDDFETYRVADGGADVMNTAFLDSNSVVNNQGPGLVNPGASYSDPSNSGLQWNGFNYYGQTSKDILSNGAGTIQIDYANFTQAIGLDANNFAGYAYSGSMEVWNGNTLVDTVNFNLGGGSGESVFLGYRNDSGITRVVVTSPTYSWSPLIDNHTYGVVPEPASLAVMGLSALALVRRRRQR